MRPHRFHPGRRFGEMARGAQASGWRRRTNRRRMAAALLCMGCVLTSTHIPPEAMPAVRISAFDKFAHVTAYFTVAILFLRGRGCRTRRGFQLLILLGLATVAVFDELTQPLVNRHASLVDLAADLIGIGIVCAIATLWSCREPKAGRSVAMRPVVHEIEEAESASDGGKT